MVAQRSVETAGGREGSEPGEPSLDGEPRLQAEPGVQSAELAVVPETEVLDAGPGTLESVDGAAPIVGRPVRAAEEAVTKKRPVWLQVLGGIVGARWVLAIPAVLVAVRAENERRRRYVRLQITAGNPISTERETP